MWSGAIFDSSVQPREWYLVPPSVIAEAVEKISDGSIVGVEYDPASATLRPGGRRADSY